MRLRDQEEDLIVRQLQWVPRRTEGTKRKNGEGACMTHDNLLRLCLSTSDTPLHWSFGPTNVAAPNKLLSRLVHWKVCTELGPVCEPAGHCTNAWGSCISGRDSYKLVECM